MHLPFQTTELREGSPSVAAALLCLGRSGSTVELVVAPALSQPASSSPLFSLLT